MIDDDLGRSADGRVDRPGFEQLVADVSSREVGAVLCLEASRLARNGRDWHHLIEWCGMVDAVVIDTDGIYSTKAKLMTDSIANPACEWRWWRACL